MAEIDPAGLAHYLLNEIADAVGEIEPDNVCDHETFDEIVPLARRLPFRAGTRAQRLRALLLAIAEAYSAGNGVSDFEPDAVLILVEIMRQRIPDDLSGAISQLSADA